LEAVHGPNPAQIKKEPRTGNFYVGKGGEGRGEVPDNEPFMRSPFAVDMRLELVREEG